MAIKSSLLPLIAMSSLLLSGSGENSSEFFAFPSNTSTTKSIQKVELFPDIPTSYRYFDYRKAAQSLDELVFDFANTQEAVYPNYISTDTSTWQPLGYWIDQARQPSTYDPLLTGYLRRSFGLPTYVADTRLSTEAITPLSMVLNSTMTGIDKSAEVYGEDTYNFVEMMFSHYDTGSKLVHNYGLQGESFWYDILPQILFARLYDLYPETEFMRQMVLNGADQWLEALPFMVNEGEPNYEFVGYNVTLEAPTIILPGQSGYHIEPPNGGLAYLFYSAYQITQETKYLQGAMEVLDYLQTYQKNPNYEALTDYAPYVAARINFEHGTSYDVGKFMDFIFDSDSAFRPGWSVLSGQFGSYPVDGLVGQQGDYAFAMNSFHLASTLVPLVKYDPRYATMIGKYLLNLVSNAKVFFPQQNNLTHQSMNKYLSFDKNGSLIYEGFRNNYNGVDGYAMGDATAMFSLPSDLSLYSSSFIGALGGLVSPTEINGILQIDVSASDQFATNDFPSYLYYNPFEEDKTIIFHGRDTSYDLYNASDNAISARNVTGDVRLLLPAGSGKVVIKLPANSRFVTENSQVELDDVLISKYRPSVNFNSLVTRANLTEASNIGINYSANKNDFVTNMKISFNDIVAYDGVPLNSFSYDKAILPDTDYTLKVEITTNEGRTDYVTKRVVCR